MQPKIQLCTHLCCILKLLVFIFLLSMNELGQLKFKAGNMYISYTITKKKMFNYVFFICLKNSKICNIVISILFATFQVFIRYCSTLRTFLLRFMITIIFFTYSEYFQLIIYFYLEMQGDVTT